MAKRSFKPKPRRSYRAVLRPKRHVRPKQDVPAIPLAVEGVGLILGAAEALKGNISGGAVLAGAGLIGGYVLEKVGNNTKIGKIKLKTKRHAISLI